MGLVKKISERPFGAPVTTVVLRELSLFAGRGPSVCDHWSPILSGPPPWHEPENSGPSLPMQKNSGPPCEGTPPYINNETTQIQCNNVCAL